MFQKKDVLKNIATFTGKHQFWNLFLNKNAGFQGPSFIKKRLEQLYQKGALEIFKNTYFEEHLRTAVSESFTWTFFYMNKYHRNWRRRFPKNKTKQKPFENSAIWKSFLFMMFFTISFFSFSPLHIRRHALHNKRWC